MKNQLAIIFRILPVLAIADVSNVDLSLGTKVDIYLS